MHKCKCCKGECNCQVFHRDTINEVSDNLISDDKINDIVGFFKVMNDFTRIKIMEAIKDHELCVCDLGHLLGVTKSAISHQMKMLKEYNIVTYRREGKMIYYKLNNNYVSNIIESVNKNIGG